MSSTDPVSSTQILAALRERTRAERAVAMQADRPTRDELLGLAAGEIHAVSRDAARRLRGTPAEAVLALASELVATRVQEARLVGYDVVARHAGARGSLDRPLLEQLGEGLDNWAAVDSFGGWLSGPAWLAGRVTDGTVRAWARSRDLWWRRVALVSTTTLNKKSKGGSGDTERTLDICGRLVADHEEMVVKAVSWALRELAPWDPAAVAAFLDEHDDVVAARVRREVRNKLRTGRKN